MRLAQVAPEILARSLTRSLATALLAPLPCKCQARSLGLFIQVTLSPRSTPAKRNAFTMASTDVRFIRMVLGQETLETRV